MTVYEKIDAQCEGVKNPMVHQVASHLKDILRSDPSLEEIVDKDLDVKNMSVVACEKALYDQGKKLAGNSRGYGFTMEAAEKIIREFYGLPLTGETTPEIPSAVAEEDTLDFADFL